MKIYIKENADVFRTFLTIACQISSELMLHFKPDMLSVYSRGGDMAIFYHIKKELFETYEVPVEEKVGLGSQDLFKSVCKSKLDVTMYTNDNLFYVKENKLNYKMPIYTTVNYIDTLREFNHEYSITLPLSSLKGALDKAKLFSEGDVSLAVKDGNLVMKSEKNQREIEVVLKESQPFEGSLFLSYNYLSNLVQPSNEEVILSMKTDEPLEITYDRENIKFRCVIAPIIK